MRLLAVVLMVCAQAAATSPAWSAPARLGQVVAQAETVQPLGQVLRQIGARYPGRALGAELTVDAFPAEVVARLAAEIQKAMDAPDVRERFRGLGSDASGVRTPEAFTAFVDAERQLYAKLVKLSGAKPD